MGISPWSQGDTSPSWIISLIPDSGTFSITGLTTANFNLTIFNVANDFVANGAGAFSSLMAASGSNPTMITYTPAAADSTKTGTYILKVVVTYSGGAQRTFVIGNWVVQ